MNNEQGNLIDLTLLCTDNNPTILREKYLAEVVRLIKQAGSPELVKNALDALNYLDRQEALKDEEENFCSALKNRNLLQALLDRQYQVVSDADAEERYALQLAIDARNQAATAIYCP